MRNISRRDYVKIDEKLTSASQALGDREDQLAKVFNEVETDLDLLGATAVEDRYVETDFLIVTGVYLKSYEISWA